MKFQVFKLHLEMAEEPEIKLPTSLDHQKSNRCPEKKIYFSFIDYAKACDYVDHNKLWKILNEMGIPDHLTCLLRNLQTVQESIELDMEQWRGSKLEKCMSRLYIVTLLI